MDSSELIYTELQETEEEEDTSEKWKNTEDLVELTEDSQDGEVISGRHYAILKDGKLHMEGAENQDKLQQLQQSLGLNDESPVEDQVGEVTGKNLLTGKQLLHPSSDESFP